MPNEPEIERALDAGEAWMGRISRRWRHGVNRRSVFFILAGGIFGLSLYLGVIAPPSGFPVGELTTIEQGTSLAEAANTLKDAGVIRSKLAFKAVVFLTGHEKDVHAGDYLFEMPEGVFVVARAVSLGAYGLEPMRIRIPEGSRTVDMAAIFSARLQRFNSERFLAKAQPLEGYLFPDTYFFLPNATDELVIETMRQNFYAHIADIQEEIDAFGKPLQDIVILASLLEREASNTEDRRKIAGVLWNRLGRDMALQVDAAFLYKLGKSTFDLTAQDLASDDPYNTYVRKGLPPGAIGSPSLDSLLAAVTPIKSSYFFYLADKNNVTHYSKTYEEHLRNKRLYLGS
jgi:UPF0755 protein